MERVDKPVGWADDEYAYVLPDVAVKQIVVGDNPPQTRQAIEDTLLLLGLVVPGADGGATTKITVDGREYSVYKIPLRLWLGK